MDMCCVGLLTRHHFKKNVHRLMIWRYRWPDEDPELEGSRIKNWLRFDSSLWPPAETKDILQSCHRVKEKYLKSSVKRPQQLSAKDPPIKVVTFQSFAIKWVENAELPQRPSECGTGEHTHLLQCRRTARGLGAVCAGWRGQTGKHDVAPEERTDTERRLINRTLTSDPNGSPWTSW